MDRPADHGKWVGLLEKFREMDRLKMVNITWGPDNEIRDVRPIEGVMPDGTVKAGVQNADGSFSTERTITIEVDGKFYNIPTLQDGKQLSDADAIDAAEVGIMDGTYRAFDSLEEATAAARARSQSIRRK